jgi:hypothetical protein
MNNKEEAGTRMSKTAALEPALNRHELDIMPLLELRHKVETMGVSTLTMFERIELKEAYKQARAQQEEKVKMEIEACLNASHEDGWTHSFDPTFVRSM